MMSNEELLNSANALVTEIYNNMGQIQTIEMMIDKVGQCTVCLQDSGDIVSLEGVLSPEQITKVKQGLIDVLNSNMESSKSFLSRLTRKPAVINKDFEAAVNEMIENSKAIEQKVESAAAEPEPNKNDPTAEELKDMLECGLKVKDIAKAYNKTEKRIYYLLAKAGISTKAKKEEPIKESVKPDKKNELTKDMEIQKIEKLILSKKEEVKALYTNGPFSIKDLAVEYNCDVKLLHEILSRLNLLKPKKDR